MKPGTIVTQRDGTAWLVLARSSIGYAIAPVGHVCARDRRKAGDVSIGHMVVRTCGVRLVPRLVAMEMCGVPTDVLAECVREAARSAGTLAVIAKHAPLADWHRAASNERTACR